MALSFANLSRVLDLIGAPLTLEILDGLGHGVAPNSAVPADSDPAAITEAVEHLRRFGAVTGPFPTVNNDALLLTPLGQRLLEALEKAENFGDPAVTT
jgi:hypothetical protein